MYLKLYSNDFLDPTHTADLSSFSNALSTIFLVLILLTVVSLLLRVNIIYLFRLYLKGEKGDDFASLLKLGNSLREYQEIIIINIP
jgi:hypothetical protein